MRVVGAARVCVTAAVATVVEVVEVVVAYSGRGRGEVRGEHASDVVDVEVRGWGPDFVVEDKDMNESMGSYKVRSDPEMSIIARESRGCGARGEVGDRHGHGKHERGTQGHGPSAKAKANGGSGARRSGGHACKGKE